MVGRKTHEQQQRVIQRREDISDAGKEFDAEAEFKRSNALRSAERKGQKLDAHADARQENDRSITRGKNQESRHHKDTGQ
ncbi:hypothetical protein [Sinorhizobium fredii]|uniref:hypothetical protein n=1 Tax=Rhizobium fredii TaxID=380 RepID=UPI0005956A3F|nr:hypothetical protein [Sinorhizobium fredii]WOS66004.1 hypothetical protein SFGR64A_19935 [Sinorhizobium fredii GR64]